MEEEMYAEVPGANTFTVYILNILQVYSLSKWSLEQQNKELLQKDWLTSSLILLETESLFPTRSEIKIYDEPCNK
jgi:hypothetical protein